MSQITTLHMHCSDRVICLMLQVIDLADIMQLDISRFAPLSLKLKSVCKNIVERMAAK